MDYVLKYNNREVARGDFFAMLSDANARGGILAITPSRKGWKWNRMLLDLAEDFQIIPSDKDN